MTAFGEFNIVEILIVLLAAYRITYLIVEEEGFLNISGYVKYLLGTRWEILNEDIDFLPKKLNVFNLYRHDVRENINEYQVIFKTEFAHALICIYCTSLWVGLVYLFALLAFKDATIIFSIPFAISSFILKLDKF